MKLKNYEEFIEYILDEFEIEDNITVICDYNLADLLNYYYGNKEYTDYKGIDLHSDINEYYVTKFGADLFSIETLKCKDKIKIITNKYFIIDSNILKNNPTLFNYLECSFNEDKLIIEVIDYDDSEYFD